MDLILKGILTGLILSIMIGPVFFVLLETSIRRGIRAAVAFDFGVLLNDVMYIFIAYVFYNKVAELSSGSENSMLKIIGGVVFLGYGIFQFFKKAKETEVEDSYQVKSSGKDYVLLALKGFLLNLANPLIVFYWFSVMTLGAESATKEGEGVSMFAFLASILITFFAIDLLKIVGAKKLRPLVTPKLLIALNRLIGIVFVAFAAILIYQGLVELFW